MNRQVLLPDGSIGWIVDQPPSSSPQVPHNHPPSVAPVQSTNNQSPSQFIYVSQQSRYLSPQAQFEQQHTRYMEVPSNSMYPPTHQFPSYQQPNSNMISFNQSSYTQPNSQMIPMNLSSNAFPPNNPNQSTFHDPSVRLITNGPTNAPIIPSQPKIDTKSSPKSYLEQHHPEFESHPDYEPMRSKFRRELKHCQDNLGLDDGRKQYWRQFAYYCLDAIIHKKNPTDEEIKQVMESIIPLAGREEPFFIHLFQVVKFCLNYKSLGVKRESIKSPATEPVVKIESNKSSEVVYIDTTKNLEDNHKLLQLNDEKSQSKEGATSSPSESRNNKLVSFSDKSSANDRQPSSRDSIPRDPYRKPSPRDPKSRDHPPTRNERKIHAAERRYKEAQHWNRERNKQGTYGNTPDYPTNNHNGNNNNYYGKNYHHRNENNDDGYFKKRWEPREPNSHRNDKDSYKDRSYNGRKGWESNRREPPTNDRDSKDSQGWESKEWEGKRWESKGWESKERKPQERENNSWESKGWESKKRQPQERDNNRWESKGWESKERESKDGVTKGLESKGWESKESDSKEGGTKGWESKGWESKESDSKEGGTIGWKTTTTKVLSKNVDTNKIESKIDDKKIEEIEVDSKKNEPLSNKKPSKQLTSLPIKSSSKKKKKKKKRRKKIKEVFLDSDEYSTTTGGTSEADVVISIGSMNGEGRTIWDDTTLVFNNNGKEKKDLDSVSDTELFCIDYTREQKNGKLYHFLFCFILF